MFAIEIDDVNIDWEHILYYAMLQPEYVIKMKMCNQCLLYDQIHIVDLMCLDLCVFFIRIQMFEFGVLIHAIHA